MKSITLIMEVLKKKSKYFKIITDANNYGLYIIIVILTTFLNSYNLGSSLSFDKAFSLFITTRFYVIILMLFMFFSTNQIINYFEKNYSFSIRLSNKNKYIKEIVKFSTLSNLIFFVIYILISVSFVILKSGSFNNFNYIETYKIPLYLYNIILLIKYFVIINYLSIFGILIHKSNFKIVSYIYYIILLIIYYNSSINTNIINGFSIKDLLFYTYLSPLEYTSLINEINNFIIVSIIYYLIFNIMSYLLLKFRKVKV